MMNNSIRLLLITALLIPPVATADPVGEIIPVPAGPVDLFVSAMGPSDWIREELADPNPRPVVQRRFVEFRGSMPGSVFNPSQSTPFEFTMVFMDDLVERVVINRIENITHNGMALRVVQGRVKSDEFSSINLLFSQDQVRGTVHFRDTAIELRPVDGKVSVIEWIDPKRFPRELPPSLVNREPGFFGQPRLVAQSADLPETLPTLYEGQSNADTGYDAPAIKILLVKSDEVGECEEYWLNLYAAHYQSALNWSFAGLATSQVDYQCIDHAENWATLEEARQFLRDQPGPVNLRLESDADLIVLLLKDGLGACGYTMHPDYPLYPISDNVDAYARKAAFAVVDEGCAATNFSLAHEIGHLLGMKHDRFNELGGVGNACGYGYPVTTGRFPVVRTIMAYDSYCTYVGTWCPRIPYYSVPTEESGGPFGWLGKMFRKCFGVTKGKSCDSTGVHHLDKPADDMTQIAVAAGDVATYSDKIKVPPP